MISLSGISPNAEKAVGRLLSHLAKGLAVIGGFVLIAIAVMTVASVLGRAFGAYGLRPVRGDFELVQIGCAIAVFSFLPWCQLQRGHVTVDIVVERFGPRVMALFGCVGNTVLTLVSAIIARQLWLGMQDKLLCYDATDPVFGGLFSALGLATPYCWVEATYELQLPAWWGYGLGLIGAMLFVMVSAFTIWRSFNEIFATRAVTP